MKVLPFAPRDTRAAAAARKRAKRRTREDPDYLAWIHQFFCVVGKGCWGPVEFHHEPPKSHAGEWSDRSGVTLCKRHHDRSIPGSRHDLGLEKFEQAWDVDLAEHSRKFNEWYEKGESE